MTGKADLSDEVLLRYVDGELSLVEFRIVDEALEHDPGARWKVRRLRETDLILKRAFGSMMDKEPPAGIIQIGRQIANASRQIGERGGDRPGRTEARNIANMLGKAGRGSFPAPLLDPAPHSEGIPDRTTNAAASYIPDEMLDYSGMDESTDLTRLNSVNEVARATEMISAQHGISYRQGRTSYRWRAMWIAAACTFSILLGAGIGGAFLEFWQVGDPDIIVVSSREQLEASGNDVELVTRGSTEESETRMASVVPERPWSAKAVAERLIMDPRDGSLYYDSGGIGVPWLEAQATLSGIFGVSAITEDEIVVRGPDGSSVIVTLAESFSVPAKIVCRKAALTFLANSPKNTSIAACRDEVGIWKLYESIKLP